MEIAQRPVHMDATQILVSFARIQRVAMSQTTLYFLVHFAKPTH